MSISLSLNKIIVCVLFTYMINSCSENKSTIIKKVEKINMEKHSNPVVYFEIPVLDMERSIKFYKTVFNFSFEKTIIDKNEMALFPFEIENSGITGALAKGEIYKPIKDGVLIYFKTNSIDTTLQLALDNGGKILYPKTSNDDGGFVAEFEDTEGNRIALQQ